MKSSTQSIGLFSWFHVQSLIADNSGQALPLKLMLAGTAAEAARATEIGQSGQSERHFGALARISEAAMLLSE